MEDLKAMQLDAAKGSLEELKQRTHELRDENEALRREGERRESEAREIITFLRHSGEQKDETIEALRTSLERQRALLAREREGDRLAAARKLKESEEASRTSRERLEGENAQLQDELQTLRNFKEAKARFEADHEQSRRERLELEARHADAIGALERKYIEEKGKLQREAKQMLAEIRKTSQEEAVERLDASSKKVLFENRRMAEELRLQVQEADELQKLSRRREDENRRLRRELELSEDSVKEYARQGARQAREVRELGAKAKALERSLAQAVREYERKGQLAAEGHERQLRELELEAAAMRQLLKVKSKELGNVKRLAQLILEKRSEVETFLLEAIEQVKAQLARERPAPSRGSSSAAARRSVLPLITPPDRRAPSHMPRSAQERVDVADLTWADRERVLRMLFAKINNSEPGQHLPAHLLDEQDDAGDWGGAGADALEIEPVAQQEGDATFLTTEGLEAGEMRGQSSYGAAAPLA